MPFIDKVKVYAIAGNGGNGCVSFRREKYIPWGGPNGGDGGRGGSVWLRGSKGVNTLYDVSLRPHLKAESGENGKGKNMYGVSGKDTYAIVPLGTQVFELREDGTTKPLGEVTKDGEMFPVAKGGRGGRGNTAFKGNFNRAPKKAEEGFKGELRTLILELRLLADVGLVGLPNAGKSTLLSVITRAKPKIAAYPFTTLTPNLGICSWKRISFTIADVPGLIEGAAAGKGLGHDFLRHLERTRVLVHLIEPELGAADAPNKALRIVQREIASWGKGMSKKPRLICVTKADLGDIADKTFNKIKKTMKKTPVLLISAHSGDGRKRLLDAIVERLNKV
ncbi:MAG: GTPase ObgE [Elusimicrobiota bacterium]